MARPITGLSRANERHTQQRLFIEKANRVERALRREISRAMTAYAKGGRTVGEQAAIQAEHRANMRRILERAWRSTFDTFGGRILDAAQKSGWARIETKGLFDEFEPLIQNWIATYGARKVTEITGTTKRDAMRVINDVTAEATAEGLGQDETDKRIRASMASKSGVLSRARSRMIARTETHAASQAANIQAAKVSGVPMKKEWVASDGPRTRRWHDAADGQTVSLSEPFIVDGEELMQPGDPSGSARNTINCRCASVMVVD